MTDNPTRCGAIGAMKIAGREVGAFVCELDLGHGVSGVDHEAVLSWSDATIEQLPDADLFDPDEHFDVEVPAPKPARQHDAECEGDWGSEGQESPCRCFERSGLGRE